MHKLGLLKEIQRGGKSIYHVSHPIEVSFEWLKDQDILVYLYQTNFEVGSKMLSLDSAHALYEELEKKNSAGDSKYVWFNLFNEAEEDE